MKHIVAFLTLITILAFSVAEVLNPSEPESQNENHNKTNSSKNLVRLVRRQERKIPGLPTTAARSLGTLTSSSSPWRISYNTNLRNKSKNTTNGWTGVVRRKPIVSTSTLPPVTLNSNLTNYRHYQLKNHTPIDIDTTPFRPIKLSFPKKNLIPKFGIGTIKRKSTTTTTTTTTTTEVPSTTTASTTTTTLIPLVLKYDPVSKMRKYVEINRRVVQPRVEEIEEITEDEEYEYEDEEDEIPNPSSNGKEYKTVNPFSLEQSGRGIQGPVPAKTDNGIDPYHPAIPPLGGFHAPHNPLEHHRQPAHKRLGKR